jgi:hypothetical protein
MVAELAQVRGRWSRWLFAAGMLRVMVVLLARHRGRALLAACGGGLIVTATATAAVAARAPDLSVFAAALGLLLTGCAALEVTRPRRPAPPQLAGGAAALAAIAAAVTAVTRIAVAHPAATADRTHVFSVLFAITLACYLMLAQALAGRAGQGATVLWWGLAGALAAGAVWTIQAVAMPVGADGIEVWLWPAGAAATLVASAGAAATAGSRWAGFRAGILAAILGALLHFSIDLTALLHIRHFTLTSPYDIAAYPGSGYHDIASYILSDAVAGDIISGLVLYPISWLLLAALGAATGTELRHLTARRILRPGR